jgi:hypothetical protein
MWITANYMVKLDLCNMRSRNLEFEGVPEEQQDHGVEIWVHDYSCIVLHSSFTFDSCVYSR